MRELLPYLRLYKRHWFGLSLGMVLAFATLFAAIGLLTLSGWFIAAAAVAGLAGIATFNYMLPAAGVRGFSIGRTFGRWAERVVSHNATFKLLADLRVSFFRKLAPLVPDQGLNMRDADLLNRMVADVDAMDHVYLRLVSPMMVGIVGILAVSFFLGWFDPRLGMALGLTLLALLIGLPILFYRLGNDQGRAQLEQNAATRIALLDWLQGHAELALFGARDRYRARIDDSEQAMLHAQANMARITGLANAVLVAATGLTLVMMIWLAADGVGERVPGPLIAMVAFTTMASFELMMPITAAFQYLGKTLTAAKRLNAITERAPSVPFPSHGHTGPAVGDICFDSVSYQYPGAAQDAVSNISLHVTPGHTLALLGRTGCGKSTLLSLLTRAWDPIQGQITLDGVPLTQWQETALRDAMSVVTQSVDLFNGTLRDNLTLACPDASDDDLASALHRVGLTGLLEGQGLDAWLGDGGRQLSGGERRRLGIARGLLHPAPIMLLDEPTEGLDVQTEAEILSLLQDHCQDKTVVIITHRLVGLAHMDTVCLMDAGRIIEQGTHQDLLARNGRYAQLMNRL
ncbi:cysteine/glutathione ABC transporter ATP-binding protein/permease CydC [Salinivibrio sp. IB868]|uniref:heme ABC transporter ATP-binding protein/permease CydC n=1 Tax=unclassified Salinivibrio TaxID=2636825 RepID=UPI000985F7CB|nr:MULTISPECIES: cysteine/glutathione ABC transporter ATP-binding protein/permease CydC [unclassified Salinivibrio]OOE65321.1 cysteine/glutathione ABC transporter ATP-binding protein/permease CydC [Salinivibrio sp. IB868]OOE77384.1 cysteine/glutathione ABC transporter ATP-binding protein/permease CydC [Salinivibrio sp. IB870]